MSINIRQVQQLLVNIGKQIAVDGIWGQKSQAALDSALVDTGSAQKLEIKSSFDELVETAMPSYSNWWDEIKHFKREEFACKCPRCGGFPVEPERGLVTSLDEIREHFGVPIRISSGVRCEKHNAEVGGVAGSRHKLGKAADFCVSGKSSTIVKVYLDQMVKAGKLRYCYCIDNSYVHADIP